jgi:N-formylglutamate amidohydrolase
LAPFHALPEIIAPFTAPRLPFSEAARRIATYWMPYHTTLVGLLQHTHQQHGQCLLLDLHSMPDTTESNMVDFVLGDRHGTACARHITDRAEQTLRALGYSTARNTPYAGAYITQQYGHPSKNCHALQIEMRRSLYMTEKTRTPRMRAFSLWHRTLPFLSAVCWSIWAENPDLRHM